MVREMKRIWSLLLIVVLVLSLAACGTQAEEQSTGNAETQYQSVAANQEEPARSENQGEGKTTEAETEPVTNETNMLVVYFSATGTTRGVAETIASVTGADIFEIIPVQEYTADDLNYNDNNSRTTKEQNDKSVRPEISNTIENWDSYSVVFLGHPIWWGEEPRIMDTFVESYDFSGKTVIPFCTSGGSGVGSSDNNLKANAGNGTWLEGTRHSGGISETDIRTWIEGLDLD